MNWQRLQKLPPILCRVLARHPRGLPFTDSEIASRCALSSQRIAFLSTFTTWDEVRTLEMREFLRGCGLDFCHGATMKRVDIYMRDVAKGRIQLSKYLRRAPHYQEQLAHLVAPIAKHLIANRTLYYGGTQIQEAKVQGSVAT
jgi:hypothetical protein